MNLQIEGSLEPELITEHDFFDLTWAYLTQARNSYPGSFMGEAETTNAPREVDDCAADFEREA